jgi:hypothetical protein
MRNYFLFLVIVSFRLLKFFKMEGYEKQDDLERIEELEDHDREELFSRAVRAGKRTYFFDVKSTRRGEYYLTLTESKKRFSRDGKFHFEKHKIFLYKEDFEKFIEGMTETIEYIRSHQVELFDEPEEVAAERIVEKE